MTTTEAAEILRHLANRRLLVHVNGVPHEMEPDEIDTALRLAVKALEIVKPGAKVDEQLLEEAGFE